MKLIYLFLCFTYVVKLSYNTVLSLNVCKEQGPCHCVLQNDSRIDLSGIGLKDNRALFPGSIYISTNTTASLLSYNPCFPFTQTYFDAVITANEKSCINAAACVVNFEQNDQKPDCHAVGMQNNVTFIEEKIDNKQVVSLVYGVPGTKSTLTVSLDCTENKEHTFVVNSLNATNQEATLSGICACPHASTSSICRAPDAPDSESHGLSTGSALLITFFTLLIAYFILGVIYNFLNGAHGPELLPHIGFWTDLPQLIIDGFIFTCSCCHKRQYSDL